MGFYSLVVWSSLHWCLDRDGDASEAFKSKDLPKVP